MQIDGTPGADNLLGTDGDDVISGFSGFDQINGNGGDDVIDGGADGDTIRGGAGSDTIDGGDGSDFIYDLDNGSDTLRGGAGADYITFSHYSSSAATETVRIDAGLDDDRVDFASIAKGTASINLGDGADRLSINAISAAAVTLTLGAGRDVVALQRFSSLGTAPTITDFATGDEGDVLDLSDYVAGVINAWDGTNPFGSSGYLRLQQSGTSTLLQRDGDGAAGTMLSFATLFTFENTDAARFTATNVGGFEPDGSPTQGRTITGTAGWDMITGTVGDDVIMGLGGADSIDGRAGNDVIDGGADSDSIQSGFGDDVVDGGEGNDFITDIGGSDILRGGEGNDTINVNQWSSGPTIPTETITVEGGAGDDQVNYYVFSLGTGTIDLGEGNDRLALSNGQGAVRATLGAGRDNVELSGFAGSGAKPVITDFVGGVAGDNILLTTNFNYNLQGWNGSSNPFGTAGYLRLVQAGADTLFQLDRDGAAGAMNRFTTLAVLENTTASTLTADNFSGFTPSYVDAADLTTAFVTAPAMVAEGDGSFKLVLTLKNIAFVSTTVSMAFIADQSSATIGSDVSVGAFSGTYSITQSPTGDYQIALGSITVLDDAVVESEETISVRVTATGQTFATGTDSIVVQVNLRSDDAAGTEGADTLTGTDRGDALRGLAGSDTLSGLGGRDLLEGGQGNDLLSGGAEGDAFLFAERALGSDRISDFGLDDVLVTTLRLADKDGDGRIAFGSDRDLDFTGGGQVVITTDARTRLTSLEFDGSFAADGITYFVYSRVGSAAGVADADLLI